MFYILFLPSDALSWCSSRLNSVLSGLNSQVSVLNRFIEVPFHTTILILIAVAWVFISFIFPLVANTLMGVLPCMHYCCKTNGTEGGHADYSTILGNPIEGGGVHNVHKVVGVDTYYIHDNENIAVRLRCLEFSPSHLALALYLLVSSYCCC